MNITKLPSGNYRIRETYHGKCYSMTVDKRPSTKTANELLHQLYEKGHVDKSSKSSFGNACKQYIESRKDDLSPATIRGYQVCYNYLSEDFKKLTTYEIEQKNVNAEIRRFSKDHSPKTVRNLHGFISAVLREDRPNLVLNTKLPKKERSNDYIPSSEDVRRILMAAKGSKYEVPLYLAALGMRRSEICALTIDDLNEDNIISINKAKVQDEHEAWITKDSTKTPAGTREILVPIYVADLIRKQGFVYEGHPEKIRANLVKYQDELGIPHFSLHKLRHYFASRASAMGIPEEEILTAGGWSSDRIMKTVYRHSMPETAKAAQQKYVNMLSDLAGVS